ncbi:MAG: class A beta-lactamase-related serine hydrolase [Acidobacteriota bacterium]|nr:class A beta-lactamase-related serine hydrolase [Acidobacteriota bacterium]
MEQRRRTFLASAAGLALCSPQPSYGQAVAENEGTRRDCFGLEKEILDLFSDLPDRKAFKIWSPAAGKSPEFLVQLHQRQRMFVASTIKALILCERLRQLDSPTITRQITEHELALNENAWSPGSPIFNPPDLSGLVSERTAMEAMVVHSDNTATDMVLKQAGADKVRNFNASIGLKNTMIPDSTRSFAGYLVGAANYKTITWDELISIPPGPLAHPFLNDVETLASSPDDLVSFFSRALHGEFFLNEETLFQFRRILSLGDINHLVPFPLGMSVFGKAGYVDIAGAHARSIAGGVYFPNRWVYFSMVLNWDAEQGDDPETVKAFYGAIHKSIALLERRLGD